MAIEPKEVTFLVTHYAQPDLLKICLDSIRKFHPGSPIIVSHQIRDEEPDVGDAKHIHHDMTEVVWASVAQGLLKECETDLGVFVEHDAFLTGPLDHYLEMIKEGKYGIIGPEEVNEIRHSEGFISQNFFMINVKEMKEAGLEKVFVRDIPRLKELQAQGKMQNIESGYGMTQTFWEKKLLLPVVHSGYAFGTYYGEVAHHLWFGSYPKRNTMFDNVSPLWMDHEAQRLIKDYWDGKITRN